MKYEYECSTKGCKNIVERHHYRTVHNFTCFECKKQNDRRRYKQYAVDKKSGK